MKDLIQSAKEVFIRPSYILIALFSALLIGCLMIWLSNYQMISFALSSKLFDWISRAKLIMLSLGFFVTNFSRMSQIMMVLIALLAGINTAMLSFYLKRSMAGRGRVRTGFAGMIIGTLGLGCSACGSIILSSLIGITASSVFMSYLPLRGAEFSLLGIGLIVFSIYSLGRKIQSQDVCIGKRKSIF